MSRPSLRIRLSAEAFAAVTTASIKSCSEDDKYGSHGGNLSGNGRSSGGTDLYDVSEVAVGSQLQALPLRPGFDGREPLAESSSPVVGAQAAASAGLRAREPVEEPDADEMEELGEELDDGRWLTRDLRVSGPSSAGQRLSVPVRSVHQVGQVQLTFPRERAEVFVTLEEVQQLGGVGHPEGQSAGAGLLSLQGAKHNRFSVTSQNRRVGFTPSRVKRVTKGSRSCLDDLRGRGHHFARGQSDAVTAERRASPAVALQSEASRGVEDVGGREREVNGGAVGVVQDRGEEGGLR
ncbi:hypothetical protein EYF80_011461 [Liparis tanakae]|uniref:Uncharacterized protein n=1 Tax=Liparis tanakae TaxID=230148 RepID=A0A4Z2IKD0_9TELE|nr:hypothetical protein EYF80_011461 [Liparis tanakae]